MRNYMVFLDKLRDTDGSPVYQIAIAPAGPDVTAMSYTNYASWEVFEEALRTLLNFTDNAIIRISKLEGDTWHEGFIQPIDDISAMTLGWPL